MLSLKKYVEKLTIPFLVLNSNTSVVLLEGSTAGWDYDGFSVRTETIESIHGVGIIKVNQRSLQVQQG